MTYDAIIPSDLSKEKNMYETKKTKFSVGAIFILLTAINNLLNILSMLRFEGFSPMLISPCVTLVCHVELAIALLMRKRGFVLLVPIAITLLFSLLSVLSSVLSVGSLTIWYIPGMIGGILMFVSTALILLGDIQIDALAGYKGIFKVAFAVGAVFMFIGDFLNLIPSFGLMSDPITLVFVIAQNLITYMGLLLSCLWIIDPYVKERKV